MRNESRGAGVNPRERERRRDQDSSLVNTSRGAWRVREGGRAWDEVGATQETAGPGVRGGLQHPPCARGEGRQGSELRWEGGRLGERRWAVLRETGGRGGSQQHGEAEARGPAGKQTDRGKAEQGHWGEGEVHQD